MRDKEKWENSIREELRIIFGQGDEQPEDLDLEIDVIVPNWPFPLTALDLRWLSKNLISAA